MINVAPVATFPRLRALAWNDDWLYASRGYSLLRARMKTNADADANADTIEWQPVARYAPAWWRNLSASSQLGFRLFRDGFHALATLTSGHMVAAVPGAILTLSPGQK